MPPQPGLPETDDIPGATHGSGASLSNSHANPNGRSSDTANSITLTAADRQGGVKPQIVYHAVKPNNNPGTYLDPTGITACPPTTAADIAHLTVTTPGNTLQVEVTGTSPLQTYSYHIVGQYCEADAAGNGVVLSGSTQDPQIHNDT